MSLYVWQGALEAEKARLEAALSEALGTLKEKERLLSASGSQVSLLKTQLQV